MKNKTEALQYVNDSFSAIWNDRMAGTVYSLYLHNAGIFFGLNELIYGRENYLSRIIEIHAMLPDLVFSIENGLADSGPDGEFRVYLRWTMEGTHLGSGIFGRPTGRKIRISGMSVCSLRDGMIVEQRDVWDNGNIFEQLGIDERDDFLSQFSSQPPLFDPLQFGETLRVTGQDNPRVPAILPEKFGPTPKQISLLIQNVWNLRNPGIVKNTHHGECEYHLPGNIGFQGPGGYCEFVFSMISVFPDLRIYIDEIISDFTNNSYGSAAVRCTLQGFHGGSGRYGEPVNRQVTIPVIMEYQFKENKVNAEWLFMSEFELIKYLHSYQRRDAESFDSPGEESGE